jgi:outer membrane protein, heavy metal efflux system
MNPIFVCAAMALVFASTSLQAAPSLVISLPGVADRVRAQNPDLAAARLRINEALGRLRQSGRRANPELETAVEHTPRFREGRIEVGFSQRFPVTNRLQLEKEVSLTRVKAAEAEVRDVERILVSQARQAVVEILSIQQRRTLLREQADLSNELGEILNEAAKRGEASPLDAGQARLEAAAFAVQARQLEAAETRAAGTLKPLLGMLPENSLTVQGRLADPVLPQAEVDPSLRPDFQATRLDAEAAGQDLAIEQARRYDDIEAGLFAAAERSEDAPKGHDTDAIIGLRLKIPLPIWNKNEGAIEAAQATGQRRRLETLALARSIQNEVEAARSEMADWAKLLDELDATLIPLASQQADAAAEALSTGQGDLQSVFRSREKRLQLSTARIDALREFHLAQVRFEAALGQP